MVGFFSVQNSDLTDDEEKYRSYKNTTYQSLTAYFSRFTIFLTMNALILALLGSK